MKKVIRILGGFLLLMSMATMAKATTFSDVSSSHPNATAIQYLKDNQVIQGYEDNTFRPDQLVNRAETLKIILLGSQIEAPETGGEEIFPDVVGDVWYARFAKKAKGLGIVSGDGDTGRFRPGDNINLAEALKIILLTNNIELQNPRLHPYNDVSPDAWFAPYFDFARANGLLDTPSDGNISPGKQVNRGLIAEIMYRLATRDLVLDSGKASYYGAQFHGRTTANGDTFDASGFTAAHRTLPFDTWLRVTNLETKEAVIVRVNDRGPYGDDARIIDLSKAAFQSISPLSRGIISVNIEMTNRPESGLGGPVDMGAEANAQIEVGSFLNATKASCPNGNFVGNIPTDTFDNITLDASLPDRVIQDEILSISGSVTGSADEVTAFIADGNDTQIPFIDEVEGGRFEMKVRFPRTGSYQLGILPGREGSSVIQEVVVLPNNCIGEVEDLNLPAPSGFEISLDAGDTRFNWNKSGYDLFQLVYAQGDDFRRVILSDDEWVPFYTEFEDFGEGETTMLLRGGNLNGQSVLEPSQVVWSEPAELSFDATLHHHYTLNKEAVDVSSLPSSFRRGDMLNLSFKPLSTVRSEAALILPTGFVREMDLTGDGLSPVTNQNDIEVYSPSSKSLGFQYATTQNGTYFLEVNDDEGLAVINVPIYEKGTYPLLPTPPDLNDGTPVNLGSNLTLLRNQFLNLVNADRVKAGRERLQLDTNLSALAQSRSDDMVSKQYFGHWNEDGLSANDLRKNFTITQSVAENIARDIDMELAEFGLMRSAIHRDNLLREEWTRAGFGITQDQDGSYIFVQLFSGDPVDIDDINRLRNDLLNAVNDGRNTDVLADGLLHNIAQEWSEDMVARDFFDFTDPDGDTLVQTIRDNGVNAGLGTYISGDTSFDKITEQLNENSTIQESKWTKIGFGIKQDSDGVIKTTVIYTE